MMLTEVGLRRMMLFALPVGVVLGTFVYGISSSNPFTALMPLGFLIVALLIARLDWWWMLVIALSHSLVIIPGLFKGLNAFQVLAAGLCGVSILAGMMKPPAVRVPLGGARWCAVGFGFVLLSVMVVRGVGVRAFGGSQWGGAFYYQFMILILLVIRSSAMILAPQQWPKTVFAMCLMSATPFMVELLQVVSHGVIKLPITTVSVGQSDLFSNVALEGGNILRIQSAQFGSPFAMIAAVVLWRQFPRLKWLAVSLGMIAFGLAGISGHRTALIALLSFLVCLAFFQKRHRWRLVFSTLALVVGLGVAAVVGGRHMPLAIQRTMTWVPYADMSPEARVDADATREWRVELWRMLLREVPDYMWAGKGFAFSPVDISVKASSAEPSMEDFITTHNYHNGPLMLLIDTGLPGLVLGSLCLFLAIVRHYRYSKKAWQFGYLQIIHQSILAWFISRVTVFYLVYGDMRFFMDLLFLLAVLESLVQSELLHAGKLARNESGAALAGAKEAG